MRASVIYEYLELYCYGCSFEEIASRHCRTVGSVKRGILLASRHVGTVGFWKFYPQSIDEAWMLRDRLLDLMHRHGLTGWRAAA